MKVIIAEKPSVAQAIASVVGARQRKERGVSNGGRICRGMGIRASGRSCHARKLQLFRLPPGTPPHIAAGVQACTPSGAGG